MNVPDQPDKVISTSMAPLTKADRSEPVQVPDVPDLSLVMPCYNEAEVLHTTVSRLVRVFEDGAPFLDSDAVNWADLIITDLLMPTSGELVLRAVRETRPLLPVILLSGSVTEEEAVVLTQLGAQEVLTKPFHFDDFLLRVARWSCEMDR